MEKALEILTNLLQARSYDENYPTNNEIKEAVTELKAKEARSCETCSKSKRGRIKC